MSYPFEPRFDANPVAPREGVKSRYYNIYTYQPFDRMLDIEFSYWPQTIRRWLDEGLPVEMTREEIDTIGHPKVNEYFGFDKENLAYLPKEIGIFPPYEYEVLEDLGDKIVVREAEGTVCEKYTAEMDDSSIPHFLSFPVTTPDDWAEYKERWLPVGPNRQMDEAKMAIHREKVLEGGAMSAIFINGPYGQLRNWMGFMNLSTAFFDYPKMIHDMVETWTEILLSQFRQLPEGYPLDRVDWWEDMAGRNGPFVSPDMFREFLQPCYHAVMTDAKKRGCAIGLVDSDGNPGPLIPNWLEEGVQIMFPIEPTDNVDALAWREKYGLEIRLRGAIDKRVLAEGGLAIDRELERLSPLLDEGGFIPHLDHLVPPDVSLKNFHEYLDKKRKWIGKD